MLRSSSVRLLEIIADEPEYLVVNKPQDLVCHPTKGDAFSSLISRARLHLGGDAYLVNRLDRETSGAVLVAKSSAVASLLGRSFEQGAVKKTYVAAVHGHVRADTGVIDAALGKDLGSRVAIKDCVRLDGAAACTEFEVTARFERSGARFSVLAVTPRSGRKHQIRIHLAHVGHPVVGDKIYGADEEIYLRLVTGEMTDFDRTVMILPNHALHARTLEFEWKGEKRSYIAPTPQALDAFIAGTGPAAAHAGQLAGKMGLQPAENG